MGLSIDGNVVNGLAIAGNAFVQAPQGPLASYFQNYGKTLKYQKEDMFYNFDGDTFQTVSRLLDAQTTGTIIGFYFAQSWGRMQFDLTYTPGSGFTDGEWKEDQSGANAAFYIVSKSDTYNPNPSWSSSGIGSDSWDGDTYYPVFVRTDDEMATIVS